jgi:hypothetical protein
MLVHTIAFQRTDGLPFCPLYTTASPISAGSGQAHDGPEVSRAILARSRRTIGALTRKVQTNF